ncbi:A24 family peptidase [uncultured Methanobrevibacter sp.]|uniref:A24 family peptidase n=1 Tax=uncultured Methanobrevibacter sp. TaxID=253161 RepID=UPI0026014B7D|nr:A24 family peptidase [uncultured Methanobrevibacter sp.]
MNLLIGGFILYNYTFIRIILDLFINGTNPDTFFVLEKHCFIGSYLVVNLLIISLFLSIASYYDLKSGIIPNKLSLTLFIYGLIFNLILAIMFNNSFILIFSIALTALVSIIAFVLWHIGFWGGGDLKLFIGLSLGLSFLDFNELNIYYFNDISYFALNNCLNDFNLAIINQYVLYPKVFSILFNGILIAFIIIALMLICNILITKRLKYYSLLSIADFKSMFNQLTTQSISIDDLCEGMVLDKYYFADKKVFDRINMINKKTNENYGEDDDLEEKVLICNLYAYSDEEIFYFSSSNKMGLTEYDIELINKFYYEGLIKNPNFKVKRAIPFVPFLTLGYFCFLVFGDFISVISNIFKLFP